MAAGSGTMTRLRKLSCDLGSQCSGTAAPYTDGESAASRAFTLATPLPGFNRPTACSHHQLRRSSRDAGPSKTCAAQRGTATSNLLPTVNPKNPAGATPITSNGWPLSESVLPTVFAAAP